LRACGGLHACRERGQDSKRGEVDDVREVICIEHSPQKRLAQDLQDVAAELRQFIPKEPAGVLQRHLARQRHLAPADQPAIREGLIGARHGRVVTKVVRSPVRPATLWMRVVSMASARVIAGRMVVSRRASMDLPPVEG
jgi:hypothetical protein